MEEKTPDLRLLEPVSPESLLPDASPPVWPLIAAAVLILLLIGWLIFRKNTKESAAVINRRKEAYEKAKKAISGIKVEHSRHAAIQVSLILRRYLAEATNDPALFETHEEFVTRRDSLERLTPAARSACGDGFQQLAALKYAPEVPDVDPQGVVNDGAQLLETIHAGFRP